MRNWLKESSELVSIQPLFWKMARILSASRATLSAVAGCPPLSTVATSAAHSLPELDLAESMLSMRNWP